MPVPIRNFSDPGSNVRRPNVPDNMKMPGPVLRKVSVSAARRCQDKCLDDKDCRAWTFEKVKKVCWLRPEKSEMKEILVACLES